MSATAEPVLLRQYKLLLAVIDAPWATRLDHKIARHVIDRYFAKFGNARASLRYLERATGTARTNIIESLRRIADKGVISVVRQGRGTRPTEYDLNFGFASESPRGPAGETSTRGPVCATPTGPAGETPTAARGRADETESYLRSMSTDMRTVSRIDDTPAVPSAPPVVGQQPDTAATAVVPAEGFEELWSAFPRKHQRSKARAAYDALAPDSELHTKLMASATAWAEHYNSTGTEKKWWKHLHTWLAQECYLEDVPEPYENAKDAAIARAKERGPRSTAGKTPTVGGSLGLSPKTPLGRHEVVIIGSDMPDDPMGPEQRLKVSYRIQGGTHDGKKFVHSFKYQSDNEALQADGQSIFAAIRQAVGKYDLSDTSELHDLTLIAIVARMGRIEYKPL